MKQRHILLAIALTFTAGLALAAPPVNYYEYDANGNSTKVTDGLTHATTMQYDRLDRRVQTQQPHPTSSGQLGLIGTQYNAIDQLTGVTDPRSLSTTYTKNAFGDILTLTSPDTGTTSFTYDNAGNMLTRTDARGAVATYTYDGMNRVTDLSYKPSSGASAEETIQYLYEQGTNNSVGRLGKIIDLSGNTIYEYDAQGRVSYKRQTTNGHNFDQQLLRDSAGRVTTFAYPSSKQVTYSYNANGQVSQININGTTVLTNVIYHPNGMVAGWEWANGQPYFRFMDEYARINGYTVGDKSQLLIFDNAGRITQTYRTLDGATPIANTTVNYTYDNLDRITGNNTSSTTHGYSYDLTGNRTNLTIGGNSYAYTIAINSNRLTAEAGPTAHSNTFDASGNLTSNGQDTYTYYASGRLKQVTRSASNIYQVKYNGLGEMVHRTHNNTYYAYDQQHHLIGEYDSSGNPIQETVFLGDIPVATIRTGGSTLQDNIYYIYTDHLNTPREIRNHANQQRWTWYPEASEAFGANPPDDNPSALGTFTYNLRFPGQLYDAATQLSYNYYRDYNSRTGRYPQSDPIGLEGGINTYAYVGNDPLSYVDPTGLFALPLLYPVGAVITDALGSATLTNIGIGATLAVAASIPSDSSAKKDRAVPYPDRKRGKFACVCRANKDGRSPDNCSTDDQDFAMGYGEGLTLTQAKRAAEKNAKDKLGAKSTHHTQCRCIGPTGDRIIPTR